ncbi:MAG: hypothetical protein F6K63_24385 [Moorea sp. SIO1G6]|uniref:hypothetical protein n=1 Tax=Moorena sp. SIO1G6 TaxID=2607840 RepID=UPI0013BF5994|nr:hypothetical protein [Moorena sp. SIO1G6]NET67351.1 hypothetical protein [Moorena sp. SIO1G6]
MHVTHEDIALICSCSAHTVNGWFNTSRRCYPPTAIHLQPLAIMDFLLEDFETIPKELLERCSAVLGRQCGLGGPPHEQLPWFPPLAIASRQRLCLKEERMVN